MPVEIRKWWINRVTKELEKKKEAEEKAAKGSKR